MTISVSNRRALLFISTKLSVIFPRQLFQPITMRVCRNLSHGTQSFGESFNAAKWIQLKLVLITKIAFLFFFLFWSKRVEKRSQFHLTAPLKRERVANCLALEGRNERNEISNWFVSDGSVEVICSLKQRKKAKQETKCNLIARCLINPPKNLQWKHFPPSHFTPIILSLNAIEQRLRMFDCSSHMASRSVEWT